MARAVLLAVVILAMLGCMRDRSVDALVRLDEGISALRSGDDAVALQRCSEAAQVLPESRDARLCVLVAAIRLHRWREAAATAQTLHSWSPEDPWLAAVATQVGHRADPAASHSLPLDDPRAVWACIDNVCETSDAALPAGAPSMAGLVALALVDAHQTEKALALLERGENGREAEELRLLLLAKEGRHEALAAALSTSPCDPEGSAEPLRARLRSAFLPETGDPGCPGQPRGPAARAEGGAGAADLVNRGLDAVARGDYVAAREAFDRAAQVARDPRLARVYLYLTALLAGDEVNARQLFHGFAGLVPAAWVDWLRSLAPRGIL